MPFDKFFLNKLAIKTIKSNFSIYKKEAFTSYQPNIYQLFIFTTYSLHLPVNNYYKNFIQWIYLKS